MDSRLQLLLIRNRHLCRVHLILPLLKIGLMYKNLITGIISFQLQFYVNLLVIQPGLVHLKALLRIQQLVFSELNELHFEVLPNKLVHLLLLLLLRLTLGQIIVQETLIEHLELQRHRQTVGDDKRGFQHQPRLPVLELGRPFDPTQCEIRLMLDLY